MWFLITVVALIGLVLWQGELPVSAVLRDDSQRKAVARSWADMRRWYVIAMAGIVALILINGSWFTIDQTEMGNLRRLGIKIYAQPLGPGLHFKLPVIDEVDRLRVTLQTIHVDPFIVSTNDNQQVTLTINYNYTIPAGEVNHLLYEVGTSGNGDIHEQAVAVVKDRAGSIFAGQNMVSVNENRVPIQVSIETAVHQRLASLFGIESHSLQISAIEPSRAFMISNEAAVNAKNAAVAAENQKRTIQFQADQAVITAKGQADSAIEAARGAADSAKLNADGNAYAKLKVATAEAESLKVQNSALAQNKDVLELRRIEVEMAKAQKWDGALPREIYASAPIPFFNSSARP